MIKDDKSRPVFPAENNDYDDSLKDFASLVTW